MERTSLFNFKIATIFLNLSTKVLTLRRDFFSNLDHILILRLRNEESSQEKKNKFVEIVVVGECYLITNHVKLLHLPQAIHLI